MNDTNLLITQTLQGRAAIYEYLSIIFKEPPKSDFKGMSTKALKAFEDFSKNSESDELKEGVKLLKEYIIWEDNVSDDLFKSEMNKAYTSLFLLGFNSIPTTASAILTPSGTMKQEPWEKVMDIYTQWGFKPPKSFNEPEDHIFVHIKFVEKVSKLLCNLYNNNEIDKFTNTLKFQDKFITEYMLNWIGLFKSLMFIKVASSFAKNNLYKAGVMLLLGFLAEDKILLIELETI